MNCPATLSDYTTSIIIIDVDKYVVNTCPLVDSEQSALEVATARLRSHKPQSLLCKPLHSYNPLQHFVL